jgi:hypothetical protein
MLKAEARCTHGAVCDGNNRVVVSFAHIQAGKPVVCAECREYQDQRDNAAANPSR